MMVFPVSVLTKICILQRVSRRTATVRAVAHVELAVEVMKREIRTTAQLSPFIMVRRSEFETPQPRTVGAESFGFSEAVDCCGTP